MRKIVSFSFDDAVTQDVRLIALLNRYGLRATFNLNSGLLGRPGSLICDGVEVRHDKLRAGDVRAVYAEHEVAGHALRHPLLTELSEDEIAREVEEDRLRLAELTGREVRGFAYPGGGVDGRVVDVLARRTGVAYARTVRGTGGFGFPENPLLLDPSAHWRDAEALMERWEAAREGFFLIWGHSYELDAHDGWRRIERLFERLARRPGTQYLTCGEALLPR